MNVDKFGRNTTQPTLNERLMIQTGAAVALTIVAVVISLFIEYNVLGFVIGAWLGVPLWSFVFWHFDNCPVEKTLDDFPVWNNYER